MHITRFLKIIFLVFCLNIGWANTPLRIVSLAPNLTEIVYAAGAGNQLVGVSAYSDYPARALTIPVVADYSGIDMEKLLALKPSLILAGKNNNTDNQLALLKQANINIKIMDIRSFNDLLAAIQWVGVQAKTKGVAEQKMTRLSWQYHYLFSEYSKQKPVKVLYLISVNPLLTLNQHNLISQLIHDCGGINIFANLYGAAPEISWSSVLVAQPDVILISQDSPNQNTVKQIMQQWPELKAVKNHQVYIVNANWTNRPGPRIILGMQQVCQDLALARK